MKVLIIDGYIDEPSCLGVSPYISYYPRYIAGALIESKFSEEEIFYTTIDYLRKNEYNNLIDKFDIVIIIAGITVPGKYFDSIPITMDEIIDIFEVSNGIKIIGGPIVFGYSPEGGKKAVPIDNFLNDNIIICKKDIESFIYDNIINDKKIL